MIDDKWIKFAEESPDERYQIRKMMKDDEHQFLIADMYYKGMLKIFQLRIKQQLFL